MIVGNQYITDGTHSHNVLWIKIKIIKKKSLSLNQVLITWKYVITSINIV